MNSTENTIILYTDGIYQTSFKRDSGFLEITACKDLTNILKFINENQLLIKKIAINYVKFEEFDIVGLVNLEQIVFNSIKIKKIFAKGNLKLKKIFMMLNNPGDVNFINGDLFLYATEIVLNKSAFDSQYRFDSSDKIMKISDFLIKEDFIFREDLLESSCICLSAENGINALKISEWCPRIFIKKPFFMQKLTFLLINKQKKIVPRFVGNYIVSLIF